MATSQYGLNHPLTVKTWSRRLFQESLKQCWLSKFIGNDSDSMIQTKTEVQKGPGDRVRVGLRMQLTGNGVEADGTLEGNEEALSTYYDDLVINQLRHAVRSDGKMSEQRIPFSIREESRMGLQDWWADRIDTAGFNQLTGNSAVTDTRLTGHNSVTAPSSGNIIYTDGRTTEATVCSASASGTFQLKYIDYAVAVAKTNSPAIRPIKVNGENKYVLFLHPFCVTDLRTNTGTGQWLDIQKAAMQGGQISKSPIYTGALGEYNGCILHESTRIPRTTNASSFTSANLEGNYRNVLCGAQAAVIAFGQNNSENKMSWVEELFDYGNQLGVSAGMIWGMKRTIFNSADFSTIQLNAYSLKRT